MGYIYLDESGRFENNKARSVVGGFFCLNRDIKTDEVKDLLKKHGIDQLHAKDLSNTKLANLMKDLMKLCKDKNIEPVIIIPKRGFFVVDDAVTYINILADGISKFLIKKVSLINDVTIVIEKRKTSKKEDYKEKIEEAIEKAITKNPLFDIFRITNVRSEGENIIIEYIYY